MSTWDIYCCICGGPVVNKFLKGREVYNQVNGETYMVDKTMTEYNWLFSLYLLSREGKIIITNGKYYNGEGAIQYKNKTFVVTPNLWHNKKYDADSYGAVCHQDCYKLLQNRLRFRLEFANICRLLDLNSGVLKTISKYGIIQRYSFVQYFEHHLAHTENPWLLHSPLKNKKNMNRILRMWKPLVERFKRNPPRKAPCESASNFAIGTQMKGNDGRVWVVEKGKEAKRWVRHVEPGRKVRTRPTKSKSRRESRKRKSKIRRKVRSRVPVKKHKTGSKKSRR